MKSMSGKLTNSCLKTILQRISVEVIFHYNPHSNWACCQTLTFKVMSMYFIFQNFSLSSSINQTFSLLGKGGLKQKRWTEKQPSLNFLHHLGYQPVPSTEWDYPMHLTWLGFVPMSCPGIILPCENY